MRISTMYEWTPNTKGYEWCHMTDWIYGWNHTAWYIRYISQFNMAITLGNDWNWHEHIKVSLFFYSFIDIVFQDRIACNRRQNETDWIKLKDEWHVYCLTALTCPIHRLYIWIHTVLQAKPIIVRMLFLIRWTRC